MNVVDRVDDLTKLFRVLVFLSNFIFEFLFKFGVFTREELDLGLKVLHVPLLFVEFVLEIVEIVLFPQFSFIQLLLKVSFLSNEHIVLVLETLKPIL